MLDSKLTLARRELEDRRALQDPPLIRHIPYVSAVSDDVLMLRDGDLMASFTVDCIAAETADEVDILALADAVAHIVTQAEPDIGFAIHRISTAAAPSLTPVPEDRAGGFAAAIDERWQNHIAGAGLRDRRTMVTVLLRPSRIGGLWDRVVNGGGQKLRDTRRRKIGALNNLVDHFMEVVAAASPQRLTVSGGQWLGLLGTLITGLYRPIPSQIGVGPIADLVASSRVTFDGDRFVVTGIDSSQTRVGAILSIKSYPSRTIPGLWDRLDLPIDMVTTHSFTPTDPVEALSRIRRTIRQMRAADDAAVSLRTQLTEAADDVAAGRVSFGNHHGTVAVFARSDAALDEDLALVRRAAQEAGAVLAREDLAARTGFFAQHPGNYGYRARAALISSRNFADFGALHGSPPGRDAESAPWGEAVTILPTVRGEPYRFNFHMAGDHGERSVGHTLVLGQTGSGKTVGIAFLAAQARRLGPRIIVFDKDRGLEMPVRALGGAYEAVRMGEPTGFNPFSAETDDRGVAWLTDWVASILGGDGLSPTQIAAIGKAVRANARAAPSLQTIAHFRAQLRAVDDDGDLLGRLSRWDADGQYGWLFAGARPDLLRARSDINVIGFDLTEIFDSPLVRTAWLSYVFRRIERLLEDEHPTLIILDEAWKLLDDVYFERRLKDWMLTMRKKNAVVVLLTQRMSHILDSAAGGSIIESAVNHIVFPNPRNTRADFTPLNLTDAELDIVTGGHPGSHLALVRSGSDSVMLDMNLKRLGPLLRVLGGGAGVGTAPADWQTDPEFWRAIP